MLKKSLISCQTSCKENLIQENVAFVRHSILGKEIHVLYLEGRHMGGGTQGRISMLFFQYFVWGLVTIIPTRQFQDSLYFGRLKALLPICLPSVYLTLSHVWLYLPGLPSPLLHNASDPNWSWGRPGNKAMLSQCTQPYYTHPNLVPRLGVLLKVQEPNYNLQ